MVWTSPYLAVLKSNESPLSSSINSSQASTLGGIMPIGALIGAFVSGSIANKIGRFWALYLSGLPQFVSFVFVELSKCQNCLLFTDLVADSNLHG